MIKTFHNNKLYHDANFEKKQIHHEDIRFTKVLTKYSTEFNNIVFIYNLCQQLDMDKKDMIAFFQELRLFFGKDFYDDPIVYNEIDNIFEGYSISKLDIKRIFRYIDKNVKKEIALDFDEND